MSQSRFYIYADELSRALLEGSEEKVLLVGSDFGYGNFGDILQLVNSISLHKRLRRYKTVVVMADNAVTDAGFPGFVRDAYSADAVVFISETPLDVSTMPLLQPVRVVRNVGVLHLYGGGFLNVEWGPYVLSVVEYLLQSLKPDSYVISGQQVTSPFESEVLRHIGKYRPTIFGARDALSLAAMIESGCPAEFSFDDATEALQALSAGLPLVSGRGLLMQLNVSKYTSNASYSNAIASELGALAMHGSRRGGVTVLQAFADSRPEVVDSRESIKQLERSFPFYDYRTLEIAGLAYHEPSPLERPIQGEIGYSCSYHVTLWLQLAGIPCWLRGSNLYYNQKRQALQVDQDFDAFLREPHLANHNTNLERREAWQEKLRRTLLAAPSAKRVSELSAGDEEKLTAWRGKAFFKTPTSPGASGGAIPADIQRLNNAVHALRGELETVLNSRSWKMTAPLRATAAAFRRFMHHQ